MTIANRFSALRYGANQTARIGWYAAQYALTMRRVAPTMSKEDRAFSPQGGLPGRKGMRAALVDLLRQDWANVEAGHYPAPADMRLRPATIRRAIDYFEQVPQVTERRLDHGHSEVLTAARRSSYPRYYLQNFHYQSDGWLSHRSARVYDQQVEVLFTGAADAMRRQGIPPLRQALRHIRHPRLLDIATGTGAFLKQMLPARPGMRGSGLDLSRPYLAEARAKLPAARFIEGKAEQLPVADAALDAISAVYLFHELPPKIRLDVAGEIARTLKPGGAFLLIDSLQTGDRPDFDGLLEYFPRRFHEPYYSSYTTLDLPALFDDAGLVCTHESLAFFSKVMLFEKKD